MLTKKAIFASILVIALLSVVALSVSAALNAQIQVSNTGKVNAVGVSIFKDSGYTIPLTSMSWNVDPGSTATQTAYLKNTKNSDIALSMTTSNWIGTPTNTTSVITFGWNAPATLAAGQSVAVTFTLTAASASDIGPLDTFTFNTLITGTK